MYFIKKTYTYAMPGLCPRIASEDLAQGQHGSEKLQKRFLLYAVILG
jgi:hypothetical protein